MITITLPWPPSTNTYYRHVLMGKHVRVLISKKGRVYRDLVGQRCMQAGLNGKRLTCRLAVVLDLFPPTRRECDVANYEKAAIDALEAAQVFVNDSQIDTLQLHRRPVTKGGKLVVTIEEIHQPQQPEQMELKA